MRTENLEHLLEKAPIRVFTGVGSRRTPHEAGILMCAIAMKLSRVGWVLRSGAADGADLAFESGALTGESKKEIYLPYPGFNGSRSNLTRLPPECFEIASKVHPAWERCSDFARKAHARNACQVLGLDLKSPSSLLICWTPDGAIDAASARNAGGTRTAIVIANNNGVPVFNLQRSETVALFREWAGENLLAKARLQLNMSGKPRAGATPNERSLGSQSLFYDHFDDHSAQTQVVRQPEQLTPQEQEHRPVSRFKFRPPR